MNSVHPVHSLDSPKSSSKDVTDDKGNDTTMSFSPLHSPSLIIRSCPGQATPAVSNSSSSDSSLHPSSYASLFRFIDSSVFTVHHAMQYLFKYGSTEIWESLSTTRRLFACRTNEVDFYLPQILVLFQQCDERNRCLLPYLSYRQVLDSRLQRLRSEFKSLLIAQNLVLTSLSGLIQGIYVKSRIGPLFSSDVDKKAQRSPSPSGSVTRVTTPESAISNALHSLKPVSVNSITSSTSSTATAAVEVVQETSGQKSSVHGGSSSSSDSLNCHGDDEDSTENDNVSTPKKNGGYFIGNEPLGEVTTKKNGAMISPPLADRGDQLTKHKRAASAITCLTGNEAQARENEQTGSDSQDSEFDLEDSGNQENEGDGGGGNSRKEAYDTIFCVLVFQAAKSARSESWVKTHSRFYTPTVASRSDTHLHVRPPQLPRTAAFSLSSFSTDLLCLPPSQTQQLGRLQDTLADFLDAAAALSCKNPIEPSSKTSLRSDKLVRSCKSQWDFVNALLCISRKLTAYSSKEQRTSHLQAELYKLNLGLPARVWLPVEKTEHVVLRIPPSAAVCLNSAEKAPYLIYVEILVCNDIMTARLPRRTGATLGFTPSNIPNPHFHEDCSCSPQLTPSSSKMYLSGARAIAAPDMISLFSTDSGESQGTTDSSVLTFSTSSNPSLTAQRTDEGPSKSEQQSKQPTKCYVNAKDIRRRLEENEACQPQRSFKIDPEDPSATVLKEPWELKARRIQESSPWRHLPGWQLTAAIVKVGDDLRQEQLAYQLLGTLQRIWTENLVDLWLRPLNVVITSPDSGLIELVQDTVSLHQIRRQTRLSLRDYIIREHGPPNSEGFLSAQKNFVQSCAAYCLVGYLFQVKDRFFARSKLGIRAYPLLTSPDLLSLTEYSFRNTHLILLVDIARTGYPELPCFNPAGGKRTVEALRQRFMLTSTEDQITRFVDCMIRQSLNSLTTRLYDNYQYYANGIQ
ncbi:unnamed protein product [Hymenolepis diminuta]|uniref:Phosphatidylinositol 4-kinase beta n=1 Tax=Hymenolepis diminuta TaxID=6216 RepID=A0A158QE22_HYMDI|nr:unnamed protein product [Hymenolepis diminuta]